MDAEGYAELLPWLVFVVVERKTGLGLGWAGGCAAAGGLGLVAAAYWRGRRAPVARLAVVLFALLGLCDVVVPSWSDQFADARAVAVVVLGVAAIVSARFSPLSAAYTVAEVVPGVREDPRFRRANVEITLAWGIAAFLVAGAYVASDFPQSPVAYTFLNWIVPLVIATGVLIWVAQRWQRFRRDIEGDLEILGLAGTAVSKELGAWVSGHDAVVHRLPSAGPGA